MMKRVIRASIIIILIIALINIIIYSVNKKYSGMVPETIKDDQVELDSTNVAGISDQTGSDIGGVLKNENTVNIFQRCTSIRMYSFHSEKYKGVFVVSDKTSFEKYIYDWKTGFLMPFIDNDGYYPDINISADGTWLVRVKAGANNKNNKIEFQLIKEKEIKAYPLEADKSYISVLGYWLNDKEFIVDNKINTNPSLDYISIYNPNVGKVYDLHPTYPNIISDDWKWKTSGWSSVMVFDPTMKYVLYVTETEKIGDYGLQLYDIDKETNVSSVYPFTYTYIRPIWRSNSTGIYFVNSVPGTEREELFFLDINGKVNQITNFSSYSKILGIEEINLSPDENFIALSVHQENNENEFIRKVLLFDLVDNTIIDTCINSPQNPNFLWSQDSNYLTFNIYSQETNRTQLVIYDPTHNTGDIILENVNLIAWYTNNE